MGEMVMGDDSYVAPRSRDMVYPEYLTVKEAASYLGVSYKWVWDRLGKEGGPPARKLGQSWRIFKAEFIAWADRPVIR